MLLLRRLQPEDIGALVKYANNKKIADYILNIPHPYTEPDAAMRMSYVWQGFKNKLRYVFAIILKERNELVGEVSLHLDNEQTAQLGYWVAEPFWRRGIATEAVRAVLKFGFDTLLLHRIYAICHEENTASCKVMLNNGISKYTVTGSVVQYGITKGDFFKGS